MKLGVPDWAIGHPGRKWWMLAAALLLVGTGFVVAAQQQHTHPLAAPVRFDPVPTTTVPTRSTATTPPPTTAPAPVVQLATARSTPVELSIPAIDLSVSLGTLGLNPDGTVQVPTDIQQPGWYRLGPSPGQLGSAVILGHVDSYLGPAVFFNLRALVAGDLVDVTLADGDTAQFKVTSVANYLKTAFPDQSVYAPQGFSALQLVTCTGAFDSQTGHYLSNFVVYSSLVAVTPPVASSATPSAS
jgi:Sortase domain